MKKTSISLLIMLFVKLNLFGQGNLYFAKQRNSKKTNKIDLEVYFDIKTKDSVYSSRIYGFTASALKITKGVFIGVDTIKTNNKARSPKTDSVVSYIKRNYRYDTVEILIKDIVLMKRDALKNQSNLFLPGLVFVFGIGGSTIFLPFMIIKDGWRKGFEEWARVVVIIGGLTGPPLLIGGRKIKYDLKKKWKLIVK